MGSRDELISRAWEILDATQIKGSEASEVVEVIQPLAEQGDVEAATILALISHRFGNIEDCDRWTVAAGSKGARDLWLQGQKDFPDFAVLTARFDAIEGVKQENPALLECSIAFQFHLIQNISEMSFYYGVKACRGIVLHVGFAKVEEYLAGLVVSNQAQIDESNKQLILESISSAFSWDLAKRVLNVLQ